MKRLPNDLPGAAPARTPPPARVLAMRVPLPAPDLAASLAFYGALGLHLVERGDDEAPRWALLALPAAPGAELLLEECAPAEPIELRLEVDSLRAALVALAAVDPRAAGRADPSRDSACVTDPAGHPVLLSQRR